MRRRRQSAQMNKTLIIQQKMTVGRGINRTEDWTEVCSVFGSIRPISASEIIRSGREEMKTSHRIRIWYREGLNSHMRIMYGTRLFEINSIINIDERSRVIEILTTEVS